MTDSGADLLRNAIVLQAYDDYKDAINGKHVDHKTPKDAMDDCERFFNSEEFTAYVGDKIAPDAIIKRAFEDVIEKHQQTIKEIEKKIDRVKKLRVKRGYSDEITHSR